MNILDRIFNRIRREVNLQVNRFHVWKVKQSFSDGLISSAIKPVVIFNASTRLSGLSLNAGFSLITSLALQKNNIPTHHVYCDQGLRPCVLGTDRNDPENDPPCRECTRTSRLILKNSNAHALTFNQDLNLIGQINGLTLDQLLDFTYQGIHIGELVLPSMRWILRKHHLEDNHTHRILAQKYIQSAWSIFQQFSQLLDTLNPGTVLVFNGMFYPEAMARLAAQQRNIPVISHEVGMLPFSAFFTDQEATAYPVKVDGDFRLSDAREARLDKYLGKRFQGNFQTAGVRFWSEIKQFSADLTEKINRFSNIVPIFTNVIFDTSQSHANTLFEHMFCWLELVIDEVKKHPETLFIIRAHPDEIRSGKESRESVSEWFSENNLAEIANLVFIPPDEYISSYKLVSIAKFVMVYNSTIGLEASIMGKPVLCAGKARYTQIPTVFFPDSINSYNVLLEQFLDADSIEQPEEMKKNARRVLYSQLFRASLPFDEFLKEDGVWRGYVRLRNFSSNQLLKGRSEVIDVVLDGIQNNHSFIREI
jgi:hypothetical protein